MYLYVLASHVQYRVLQRDCMYIYSQTSLTHVLWPNVNSQHIIYSNTHYNFSLLVCAVCPTAINRNYLLTYTCKTSNWHIRIYLMTSSSPYFVTVWENLPLLVKFGKKSKLIEIEKKKNNKKKKPHAGSNQRRSFPLWVEHMPYPLDQSSEYIRIIR